MHSFFVILEAIPENRILAFDIEFVMELCIQWINTFILILFLAKFLYKPVKKFMADRVERISTQLLAASNAEHMALELKSDYEGKLQNVEQETTAILGNALRHANEKSGLLISEARQDAEKILMRAHKDIEMAQEKARDDMKKELIDLSTLMAERFTAISLDRQAQDRLIAEAISDLGDVKWLR